MLKKLFFFIVFFIFCSVRSQETSTIKSAYEKGEQFLYKNRDSTYFYFNKARRLANQEDNLLYYLACHTYLLKSNAIYYDLGNFQRNLKELSLVFERDERWDDFQHKERYLNLYVFYKGQYHYKIGEYEKAEYYFLRFYENLKNIPAEKLSNSNLRSIYSAQAWLGNIHFSNQKYSLAKKYYSRNIDFIQERKEEIFGKSSIALANLSLVNVLDKEGKYKDAEKLIKKSLGFYESVQEDLRYRNPLIASYQLLTNNYLKQKQPDKALLVLEQMNGRNLLDRGNLKFLGTNHRYQARAFAQKGNFENALQSYQKALKNNQEYYHAKHHPDIAEIYVEIAEIHAKQHQFEKSLACFQKALSALSKDFKNKGAESDPLPEKVTSKLTLVEVFRKKQKTLADVYREKNDLNYLKLANQTAQSLVRTLDALKPEFESKVDMQFLLEETYPAFYQMMETAFLLYKKTREKQYLLDAFYYSEKSKAVLLLSAVQKTGATKFAGVPDSTLVQEKHFRATINHLEKKHFENPNSEQLKDKLFDIKNDFSSFLHKIEEKYPKYHNLKYKTKVASLAEIQDLLKPQEAILDYYLTEKHLYYFVIGKEKTNFGRVPFAENFAEQIVRLQKHFSHPQVTKIKELQTLSDEVYRKLIPEIDASISTLIILRSGMFNYLPFEALYNKEKKKYLLEKYTVSYANSATLYLEYANQKENPEPKMLAFAPSFSEKNTLEGTGAGLGQLLYNQKEVQLISDYFDGKILLNEQASLNTFATNAKKFGILHLATHAIVNDEFPDYSYLAFAPEKDSLSNLLYIKDLYSYKLNADLVVLSACETGIGKLQKGAGMLSLAKGFNYAGASSLVTTQWKIDDKSTLSLMNDFYKNLAKGQAKNTALRNAKLRYLETTDDVMLRHPYYWAGFVVSGDVSPIVSKPNVWPYVLIAAIILIVLLFFFRRKRTKVNGLRRFRK